MTYSGVEAHGSQARTLFPMSVEGHPMRNGKKVALLLVAALAAGTSAQVRKFVPVTTDMLVNPSPNDWLMFSRTYDGQRFSPLKQLSRQNVSQLKLAWTYEL